MAKQTICNLCGKILVTECDLSIHTRLGYGSKYDGSLIDLDLCPECTDKLIDAMKAKCKVPLLSESYLPY